MRRFLLLLLLFFFSAAHAQKAKGRYFVLPAGLTTSDYLPNTVIVKIVKEGLKSSGDKVSSKAPAAVPEISLQSAVVQSFVKKFSEVQAAVAVSDSIGLDRVYELSYRGSAGIETVINELLQNPGIEYAEPDYVYYTSYTPSDPLYLSQGQPYLSQVRAPQAWDINRNSSKIIIGIIDSGSGLDHPDLAANIYINTADPINGIDDDKDGYVDNYRGWDFIGSSAGNIRQDNDPSVKMAANDHGVHVSGIASAVADNGIGIAGIAFNAKLLIIKSGADDNSSAIYKGYDGIKYAADHGANIINCSWGGAGGGAYGRDIIRYAISKGCLIVAAAGNENTSDPEYPAAYPGVFAVANVESDDRRSFTSNYGSHISISAPGSDILSTGFSGYKYLSGTSMSAPLVAGAAALVASYFPDLTMQQVGEKLRASSDNIDNRNSAFRGQLGKGRLNVFRALTESLPSVRYQKISLTDKSGGSYPPGDTLLIYIDLKNFLLPAATLSVALSTSSQFVSVLTPAQNLGALGTLEARSIAVPYRVVIRSNARDNTPVIFRLDYASGTYLDFETFTVVVARDYQNIEPNAIATTITSNGKIGYGLPFQVNGQGFVYRNNSVLFEASLMIGTSATRLSDNARADASSSNAHFVKRVRVSGSSTSAAAFEGNSEFDDSANPAALNIYVKHRQLAYSQELDSKYIIAEYELVNKNTVDLTNVYAGLFTDWDVFSDGDNELTRYDAANRLAYVSRKSGPGTFAGVKLLSSGISPVYFPLAPTLPGDILKDDTFSTAEKFRTLSNGIYSPGLGDNSANGLDVMFVSGYGPFNIPAGASVTLAFALIGGDNLNDLVSSAQAAHYKYSIETASDPPFADIQLKQNYPNPAKAGSTTIEFSIPREGNVSLALYNLIGQKVKTLAYGKMSAGVHAVNVSTADLMDGVYYYRIQYNNTEKALKMMVFK